MGNTVPSSSSSAAPSGNLNNDNKNNNERTDVYYGTDTVLNTELQFFSNSNEKIDSCMNYTRPELAIEIEQIKKAFIDSKNRGVRLRYLTEITSQNISFCKELNKIVGEIRHLDGIKGNFMLSESEYLAPLILFRKGEIASQIIYSNIKEVIEHQQYVFDTLWNKSISADKRIKQIEEGTEPDKTEFILDTRVSITRALNIISSAQKEVLAIFATSKTFALAMDMDVSKIYTKAINNGAKIRLLIPDGEGVEQIINEIKSTVPQVYVRIADKSLQTKITILVVDRRELMTWELKDDNIKDPYEAGGLATYSNNESVALSYATIFKSLWRQTELYEELKESKEKLETTNEQLKLHDKMQNEFINIAAHELRTPVQPILGLSDVLRSRTKDTDQYELLDAIIRNAKRLQRLTENILDVTRIESHSLQLKRERFSLNEIIRNVINDVNSQAGFRTNSNVTILFEPKQDVFVEADKVRIYEVISNLLKNAVQFTKEGTITIAAAGTEKVDSNEILVSIKDTGTGIDPEILPRLFTKFATKSVTGTGLGLFISKNIVEAHGGRMWAQNNADGKGSTFYFTLPLGK
ncbi:MAG TPA: HAMP domain-containing sensor histidine kinase [Nitrososphaeraceae archaeon]|nr:HAMP domain-containing sensor histidine kinase [Nitrososphaeraceae archaeon]